MKPFILTIIFLASSFIECQVTLNRELLEKWYVMTGCPMLLNTSLNIRGEPMVNDRKDADRFEKLYNIPVIS